MWKDRKWQQVVRVTEQEIVTACALWHWDGDDLVVAFYPEDKEAEVRKRREMAVAMRKKPASRKKPVALREEVEDGAVPDGNVDVRDDVNVDVHVDVPDEPGVVEGSRGGSSGREREGERKEKEKGKGSTPLSPPGGFEGVLPGKWETITDRQAKFRKVLRNNAAMDRIGTWFNRRRGTPWALAEGIALCRLAPDADDLELLEPYYLAEIPKASDRRRQDLMNLLDHWSSELDRARIWRAGGGGSR